MSADHGSRSFAHRRGDTCDARRRGAAGGRQPGADGNASDQRRDGRASRRRTASRRRARQRTQCDIADDLSGAADGGSATGRAFDRRRRPPRRGARRRWRADRRDGGGSADDGDADGGATAALRPRLRTRPGGGDRPFFVGDFLGHSGVPRCGGAALPADCGVSHPDRHDRPAACGAAEPGSELGPDLRTLGDAGLSAARARGAPRQSCNG